MIIINFKEKRNYVKETVHLLMYALSNSSELKNKENSIENYHRHPKEYKGCSVTL